MLGESALGKTPVTVTIKKKSGQRIKFEKPGFKPQEMPLETGMDSWFLGNIILGGLLGSTTDGLSGAVHEYKPNHYFVTLEPDNKNSLPADTTRNKMKVKEFIVMAYINISKDMAAGSGEYYDSLLNLLSVPKEKSEEALKKLRSLSDLYPDVPIFADRVIEFYNVQ